MQTKKGTLLTIAAIILGLVLGGCRKEEPPPVGFGQVWSAQADQWDGEALTSSQAPAEPERVGRIETAKDWGKKEVILPSEDRLNATKKFLASTAEAILVGGVILAILAIVVGFFAGAAEIGIEAALLLLAAWWLHEKGLADWGVAVLTAAGVILAIAALAGAKNGAWKGGVALGPLAILVAGELLAIAMVGIIAWEQLGPWGVFASLVAAIFVFGSIFAGRESRKEEVHDH